MPSSSPRRVPLGPDGTWGSLWLVVVIAAPTGVVYEQQCAGVACDQRKLEGYLVPLGGMKVDANAGFIDADELTSVFHDGRHCVWSAAGDRLADERLSRLRSLVGNIPFWAASDGVDMDERSPLQLDESGLREIAEAWVPVRTPYGRGVLMWNNCD